APGQDATNDLTRGEWACIGGGGEHAFEISSLVAHKNLYRCPVIKPGVIFEPHIHLQYWWHSGGIVDVCGCCRREEEEGKHERQTHAREADQRRNLMRGIDSKAYM